MKYQISQSHVLFIRPGAEGAVSHNVITRSRFVPVGELGQNNCPFRPMKADVMVLVTARMCFRHASKKFSVHLFKKSINTPARSANGLP
jgi:hypothetical protein